MNDASSAIQAAPIAVIESRLESKLGKGPGMIGTVTFSLALLGGIIYAARQLVSDLAIVRVERRKSRRWQPLVPLMPSDYQ
jgi:hypothetical protein